MWNQKNTKREQTQTRSGKVSCSTSGHLCAWSEDASSDICKWTRALSGSWEANSCRPSLSRASRLSTGRRIMMRWCKPVLSRKSTTWSRRLRLLSSGSRCASTARSRTQPSRSSGQFAREHRLTPAHRNPAPCAYPRSSGSWRPARVRLSSAAQSSCPLADIRGSIFWSCTKVPRRSAAYFARLRLCLFSFCDFLVSHAIFVFVLFCLSFCFWILPPPLHLQTHAPPSLHASPSYDTSSTRRVGNPSRTHVLYSNKLLVSFRFLVTSMWISILAWNFESRKLGIPPRVGSINCRVMLFCSKRCSPHVDMVLVEVDFSHFRRTKHWLLSHGFEVQGHLNTIQEKAKFWNKSPNESFCFLLPIFHWPLSKSTKLQHPNYIRALPVKMTSICINIAASDDLERRVFFAFICKFCTILSPWMTNVDWRPNYLWLAIVVSWIQTYQIWRLIQISPCWSGCSPCSIVHLA